MKIAICDDNLDDTGALEKAINLHKSPHELFIFTSAQDFLAHLSNGLVIDLLFWMLKCRMVTDGKSQNK